MGICAIIAQSNLMAVNKIALGKPKTHFQTKAKPMVMIPRNYKN
jgi:hypothetical protein